MDFAVFSSAISQREIICVAVVADSGETSVEREPDPDAAADIELFEHGGSLPVIFFSPQSRLQQWETFEHLSDIQR